MRVLSIAAAAIALICPLGARASCDTGAPPAYEDITYVKVAQFALVGQQHPRYIVEAAYFDVARHFDVSMDARQAVGITGSFVAVAPLDAFQNIVRVLKQSNFFAMRLHPTTALHLDGPEDSVTVTRCGVSTTLATTAPAAELNLEDAQGESLFVLLADLRAAIFAQKWTTPPPT